MKMYTLTILTKYDPTIASAAEAIKPASAAPV
jgi:hypothetical protein